MAADDLIAGMVVFEILPPTKALLSAAVSNREFVQKHLSTSCMLPGQASPRSNKGAGNVSRQP